MNPEPSRTVSAPDPSRAMGTDYSTLGGGPRRGVREGSGQRYGGGRSPQRPVAGRLEMHLCWGPAKVPSASVLALAAPALRCAPDF